MTPERLTKEKIDELMNDIRMDFCQRKRLAIGKIGQLYAAALRLSAIKAAGDEEVESLRDSFYKLLPLNTLEARRCGAFDASCEIILERGQEIADLRAKLGEANEMLEMMDARFNTEDGLTAEEYKRLRKIIAESEVGGGS